MTSEIIKDITRVSRNTLDISDKPIKNPYPKEINRNKYGYSEKEWEELMILTNGEGI